MQRWLARFLGTRPRGRSIKVRGAGADIWGRHHNQGCFMFDRWSPEGKHPFTEWNDDILRAFVHHTGDLERKSFVEGKIC